MNVLNDFPKVNLSQNNNFADEKNKLQNITKTKEYKPDLLDKFGDKFVNRRDIEDTVSLPRTIFKGYFCFTAGTMINSVADIIKKDNKLTKGLKIFGSILSLFGTYNFVKPYFVKDKNTDKKKKLEIKR